ncbi:Permease of the drug/metabolite transporter (DMT) superfamily [Desulfacinum hydrothermale DSM 13146]|uniref:Permease of the drug/metabolite transporter (DMT) superfamily n=1 Tax=Desulfacinum hydrothermale DSM 13146 TaxID=1121390 RepID=A0A1W1XNR3_9BACT|nr:DMT family transporter [Desulfacinum hydrothermale]SMC25620.1 Permease of the drug/metabolite transporter (DMT) superfamily [Desulfacinum hydrothermale DSM 13146]
MLIYAKLALTALFWGGTFVAGRLAAQEVPPFTAAFLRFVCATLFLTLFLKRSAGRLPRPATGDWPVLALLGFSGVFAYNAFFFSGLKWVPAGRASLIIACNPAMIALFSALLLKERLGAFRLLGVAISVLGAFVIISRGDWKALAQGGVSRGDLLIFGCVASWVTYSIAGKRAMARLDPLCAVTYSCLLGTLFLSIPAHLENVWKDLSNYSWGAWACLFYLGFFGTALGFQWYYEGIRALGPSRAGVFINLVPVSAVSLSFIFLHETLSPSLLAGAILVLTGVYLTNRRQSP